MLPVYMSQIQCTWNTLGEGTLFLNACEVCWRMEPQCSGYYFQDVVVGTVSAGSLWGQQHMSDISYIMYYDTLVRYCLWIMWDVDKTFYVSSWAVKLSEWEKADSHSE